MQRFDPSMYLHPMSPQSTHLLPGGELRKPVEALLCDVYGTLFISGSGDIGSTGYSSGPHPAIERLLQKHRFKVSSAELPKRLREAIQEDHLKARSHAVDYPEVVIEKIWLRILPLRTIEAARRFAAEYEMITNPVWPMPGLRRLLDTCRRSGIRLGIVSNAQFYTPLLFEWALGKKLTELGFDPEVVIFSFEHGCAKPCGRLFDLAQRGLACKAVPPERTAFIGNDLRNDIAPAARQGFQTILFAGDARSLRQRQNEINSSVRPDRVITELIQLIDDLT